MDLKTIGFKADTSGVKKLTKSLDSMGQAGSEAGSKVDSANTKMTSGLSAVATKASTAATAIGTAATAAAALGTASAVMFNQIATATQELQANANVANMTTAEFQKMAFVYEQLGLTVEQVSDIYKDSTERIGDWLNNQSGALEDFGNAMGMSKDELTAYASQVRDFSGQALLQDMIDKMSAAGVSATQMNNAIESMASEAQRMIPALENGGLAAQTLADRYEQANAALQLTDSEIAQWSGVASNFDLFTDTVQNGMVKALTPIAGYLSQVELIKTVTNEAGEASIGLGEDLEVLVDSLTAGAAAAGVLASISGGKALASMVSMAAQSKALEAQKLSETKATYSLAQAEQASAASKVSGIKDTIAALEAEIQLETQRIKAQINQQGRNASVARTIELQKARLAMIKQLTVAESQLTAAQSAATKSLTTMKTAQAAATVSTRALTTAQRGLAAASSFMLGPWGMAITAIGIAATTLISTTDEMEELTGKVDKQSEAVKALAKEWNEVNDQGRASIITQYQSQIAGMNSEIATARSRITGLQNAMSSMDSSGRQSARAEIERLNDSITVNQKAIEDAGAAMSEAFNSTLPTNWTNPLSEDGESNDTSGVSGGINQVKAQLESLTHAYATVGYSARDSYIDQQVQLAKTNGATADQLTQVERLAAQYWDGKQAVDAYNDSIAAQGDAFESIVTGQTDLSDTLAAEDELIKSVTEYGNEIAIIKNQIDEVNQLVEEGKLNQDEASPYLANLQDQLDAINDYSLQNLSGTASSWASALSGMAESGSSLESDMQNVATGLSAVSSFASGDYLSGAISTISLIDSIGDVGDAYEADEIQAEQFLDDWDNKQDSIVTATETAASASEDLVAINTDMLDALEDLTAAIASASSLIAGDVDLDLIDNESLYTANILAGVTDVIGDIFENSIVGQIDSLFGGIGGSILGTGLDIVGSLLGGSSSTVDSGIQIVGGYITDLVDDVLVNAYETVKYKKYAWSSSSKKTGYSELDSELENQFSQVFSGVIDSVYEAASLLNMSDDDIIDAISDFYIDTTKISLDGLSDDEIEDEITAYFSDVFNDLAETVIPYLEDFQDAGEELADTLTRLATEVSTLEVLFDLGVAFGNLYDSSEGLVAAADNIADLVGGDDAFTEYLSSFLSDFADDSVMMGMYGDQLTEALSDVGLALPSTSEGFYDLLTSLDASTASGQEQIATVLEMESTAAAYYGYLEDITDSFDDLKDSLWDTDEADAVTSISQALSDALSGDFSTTESLLENGISLDATDYSSLAEYEVAQATASNQLDLLESLYTGETTIDEQQLDYLQQIADNTAMGEDGSMTVTTEFSAEDLDAITSRLATQGASLDKMTTTLNDLSDTVTQIANTSS